MIDREAVARVMEQLKPLFLEHEGDIDIVEISDEGTLKVKLVGQCQICVYKEKTVRALEQMMKSADTGITGVEAV